MIRRMPTLSRSSKVLLVADVRGEPFRPGVAGTVRRYRLARLRFDPPSLGASGRAQQHSRVRA